MAGIEASLRAHPGLEVCATRSLSRSDLDRLEAFAPDVIVFEVLAPHTGLDARLLRRQPGVRLIGVDIENDTLLLLSCHSVEAPTLADLVDVIRTTPKVA